MIKKSIIPLAGSQEKVHGEEREGRADHSKDRLPQIQHSETGNVELEKQWNNTGE